MGVREKRKQETKGRRVVEEETARMKRREKKDRFLISLFPSPRVCSLILLSLLSPCFPSSHGLFFFPPVILLEPFIYTHGLDKDRITRPFETLMWCYTAVTKVKNNHSGSASLTENRGF